LDQLGGGVFAGPQRIAFGQGSLKQTDQPLDVALTREDEFFAVRTTDGDTGEQSVRLTRNGQFSLNAANELVTQQGHPVLSTDEEPIIIPAGSKPQIGPTGGILINGEPIAQLQVARVANTEALQKMGENLFDFEGSDPREIIDDPLLNPGMIELSGADPIRTLMSVIDASKSAMSNANMMRYHDLLMDRAVNTLGSVA
ncbi:MAG: hypothetical protein MJA84_00345, partial [Firmicutes bacterium]|nr:hypothetical protein [Bacillota bacterium]